MNANPLLHKAQGIARAVKEQNGRALLVGGFVRDELLGLNPKDADLEVYGIEAPTLRELLKRFGKVDCVGESFRVYKLAWHDHQTRHELDVSLPRRDIKTGKGHKGFEVEGDPFASVEDAARRRDFTVNAILKDPLTDELLDPFNGRQDLENRVLRMVDAAHFAEDSLRVLRAMQFAARFEMTIDPATVDVCRAVDLSDLPRERIWGEWEKLLLKADKPSIGLKAAHELGILEKLFPCLERWLHLKGAELCAAVDRAAQEKQDLPREKQIALMLASLDSYLQHDPEPEWMIDSLGVKTIDGYKVSEQVIALADWGFVPSDLHRRSKEVKDGEFRRLALECEPPLLYHFERAFGEVEAAEWFKSKMQELNVWDGPPAPLLLGRHLLEMGLEPGPQIGQITRAVYEMQLDGDVSTLEEAQEAARRLLQED